VGECRRLKIIGKPYSGKPNVRFDEGELEIEPSATTPDLYSTVITNPLFEDSFFFTSVRFFILQDRCLIFP